MTAMSPVEASGRIRPATGLAALIASAALTLWLPIVGAVAFALTVFYAARMLRRPWVTIVAAAGLVVALAATPGIFLRATGSEGTQGPPPAPAGR